MQLYARRALELSQSTDTIVRAHLHFTKHSPNDVSEILLPEGRQDTAALSEKYDCNQPAAKPTQKSL